MILILNGWMICLSKNDLFEDNDDVSYIRLGIIEVRRDVSVGESYMKGTEIKIDCFHLWMMEV